MFFIARFFLLVILVSFLLSTVLGGFAMFRLRRHMSRTFGFKAPEDVSPPHDANVIEGEYRVLTEKDKE